MTIPWFSSKTIYQTGAAGVAIDITAIEVLDSFMARILNDIGVAVQLLGAQVVIIGMNPTVAMVLVEMGLDIPNVCTALNLENGLRIMREKIEAEKGLLVPEQLEEPSEITEEPSAENDPRQRYPVLS
jgi:rsbT antagonist protein RsbS